MLPKRIASAAFVMLLLVMTAGYFIAGNPADNAYAETYDKYTNRFDVDMDVHKDNTIDVKETIIVDFLEHRHGIYRYIPLTGTIALKRDGKVYEADARIRIQDMEVEGYNFETYTENDSYVVKIGDGDQYVFGKQVYKISYKVVIYEDQFDSFDFFYYNAIPFKGNYGGGWDTPIKSSTITINMPKKFDADDLSVYAGYYGITKEDSDEAGYMETSVSGKTITVKTQKELPLGYGISVQEFLPQGYYEGAANENGMNILVMIAAGIAAIISLLLFFIFGRDDKAVETVEFYPPEDMTSAEVGYVIDGYADDPDIISLIMYYADKGYLTIEEEGEGKKKTFTLHKVKDLPADSHLYETLFFNGLFMGNREHVTLDELKENNFYEDIKASKQQLTAMYRDDDKKRVFSKKSDGVRVLTGILMMVPCIALAAITAWFAMDKAAIYLGLFGMVILIIGSIGCMSTYDRVDSMKKSKRRVRTVLYTILMLFGLAWCCVIPLLFGTTHIKTGIICVLLATLICFMCVRQMRKRTRYGTEMYGKLLGFRNFLDKAEVPKLEALVEENPSYFFNVLPFAYVFGLSDKWAKKFESIAVEQPDWYRGYYGGNMFNTILFLSMFNSFNTSFTQTIQIPKSNGGGLGGGSFGGGGGFGGGGFGGGGGGSW